MPGVLPRSARMACQGLPAMAAAGQLRRGIAPWRVHGRATRGGARRATAQPSSWTGVLLSMTFLPR